MMVRNQLGPMRQPSPFPPGPSVVDRVQALVALVGLVVLAVVVVTAVVSSDDVPPAPAAPAVSSSVVVADQFGPVGGGVDETRFYGPSDLLDDLRNVEMSEAELWARWEELTGSTVENIRQPVADMVAPTSGEGTP